MDVMKQSIIDFPNQLLWHPEIKNTTRLQRARAVIIAGMGGSALPGEIAQILSQKHDIRVHRNYGLPDASPNNTIVLAISYSGNTAETIDALKTAIKKKIPCAVIATGGTLIKKAKNLCLPYIELPQANIQPRIAGGLMLKAIFAILNEDAVSRELEHIEIKSAELEAQGKRLAKQLQNKIPVIYASERNAILARMWKIKFNETGKIPAFYNVLPELNHNEMTGFDWNAKTRHLAQQLFYILLQDTSDDPRIIRRMRALKTILRSKKLKTISIPFTSTKLSSLFETILYGDWAAYYIARENNADPNNVPLVERFKKLIA